MGGGVRQQEIRVARMRPLLVLLGFLLAGCLADNKYQAEEEGGLSLNVEPEPQPEPELNLRGKRVPKKNNSKGGPKNSNAKSNKPQKSLEAKKNQEQRTEETKRKWQSKQKVSSQR